MNSSKPKKTTRWKKRVRKSHWLKLAPTKKSSIKAIPFFARWIFPKMTRMVVGKRQGCHPTMIGLLVPFMKMRMMIVASFQSINFWRRPSPCVVKVPQHLGRSCSKTISRTRSKVFAILHLLYGIWIDHATVRLKLEHSRVVVEWKIQRVAQKSRKVSRRRATQSSQMWRPARQEPLAAAVSAVASLCSCARPAATAAMSPS
mmetsp:Transcript_11934/g.33058  ORF Transcript_11934/g.33058 Transcript_11934/m.33058 type:complete len:202 (+) Transcript_11934:693-1298(+)